VGKANIAFKVINKQNLTNHSKSHCHEILKSCMSESCVMFVVSQSSRLFMSDVKQTMW